MTNSNPSTSFFKRLRASPVSSAASLALRGYFNRYVVILIAGEYDY